MNLAEPADDPAPIRPKSCDALHPGNADDLRSDDLLISGVHQLVRPVELVAPRPEAELVVEAVRGKHVPVSVELSRMSFP